MLGWYRNERFSGGKSAIVESLFLGGGGDFIFDRKITEKGPDFWNPISFG